MVCASLRACIDNADDSRHCVEVPTAGLRTSPTGCGPCEAGTSSQGTFLTPVEQWLPLCIEPSKITDVANGDRKVGVPVTFPAVRWGTLSVDAAVIYGDQVCNSSGVDGERSCGDSPSRVRGLPPPPPERPEPFFATAPFAAAGDFTVGGVRPSSEEAGRSPPSSASVTIARSPKIRVPSSINFSATVAEPPSWTLTSCSRSPWRG